jgi:hypothetical protein
MSTQKLDLPGVRFVIEIARCRSSEVSRFAASTQGRDSTKYLQANGPSCATD